MHRIASALLFCVAIVATAVIIAFGVLRASALQRKSAVDVNLQLLARGACQSGTAHAIRQIIEDFTTRDVSSLGGPAYAPFVTHVAPYATNESMDGATGARLGVDDIPASDNFAPAIWAYWWAGFYQFPDRHFMRGATTWDGRGRYHEVNLGWRSATAGGGQPSVNRRFGDPVSGTPDFNEPVYYDRSFRPVPSSAAAAYRLRYAGGVMNLDDALLVNGDPGIDYSLVTGNDPSAYVGNQDLARLVRHQYAMQQISVMQAGTSNRGQGAHVGHLYLNRGSITNHDLRRTTTGSSPVTFPVMYRSNPTNAGSSAWLHHSIVLGSVWDSQNPPPALPWVATSLFGYDHPTQPVSGLPGGGELLPVYKATGNRWAWSNTFSRCLVGPQFSFNNLVWSSDGDSEADGYTRGELSFHARSPGAMFYSPFGRGLRTGAQASHFTGPADTPWYGNILTTPWKCLRAKVLAYLPQDALRWYATHKTAPSLYSIELPHISTRSLQWDKLHAAFELYRAPRRLSPAIDPDLNLPSLHPPTSAWRSPGSEIDRTVHGWGWTGPRDRYPGEMCFNGYDANDRFVHDTLGKFVVVSDRTPARDILTCQPFVAGDAGDYWNAPAFIESLPSIPNVFNDAKVPQTQLNDTNYSPWELAPHQESWWTDILAAMNNACAVARAQHMPYRTDKFDPATAFSGVMWSGSKVGSIADFDALFLSCLGIDPAHPDGAGPVTIWYCDKTSIATFKSESIPHSIASLLSHPEFIAECARLGYSPIERTQVMELVLNDFRLSMFGVSPDYWPVFRPYDFNHDGKTACSGYPVATGATRRETELGIAEYVLAPAQPSQPFCLTGAWFIGKSRFWRTCIRGELYDNISERKVSEAILESVVCIDPADCTNELAAAGRDRKPGMQYSTHVIFQRWHWDYNQSMFLLSTE